MNRRILFVTTSLNTGGAEKMLCSILSSINPHYWEASVVCLSGQGSVGRQIVSDGYPVQCLGMRQPSLRSLFSLKQLKQIVEAVCPVVIQGWMYHGNIAATTVAAMTQWEVPVLWGIRHCVHSLSYERFFTRWLIRMGALASHSPKFIVYNAQRSLDQHQALGYSKTNAVLIPNGFDTEQYRVDDKARITLRAELGLSQEVVLIGLMGRWHPMKDHRNFIQAARNLCASRQDTYFVMAGTGVDSTNQTLVNEIKECGLRKRFYLLGEREDMPQIQASLDIATSASYSEAFPNVIGEAMACGVPCVVTDVGDSARLVGDTGCIVPPRNPSLLAAGWEQLLSLPFMQRRAMGLRARNRIKQRYSLLVVAKQYENLYLRCLEPCPIV